MHILRRQLFDGTSESVSVTKGVFTNLILQNIGPSIGAPAPAPPWDLFPARDPIPDAACLFLELIAQAVALCRSGAGLESADDGSKLTGELSRLEQGFVRWEAQVPDMDSWKYKVHHRVANQGEEVQFPATTITFHGVTSMLLWILFWMARLDVLQTLYRVLPTDNHRKLGVLSRVSELVDIICSAVPNLTSGSLTGSRSEGGANGSSQAVACLFAMRSLSFVGQAPELPEYKADWIAQQLERLGHEAGIVQAFVWATQLRASTGRARQ